MEDILQKAKELQEAIKNIPENEFNGGILLIYSNGKEVKTIYRGRQSLLADMINSSTETSEELRKLLLKSILTI